MRAIVQRFSDRVVLRYVGLTFVVCLAFAGAGLVLSPAGATRPMTGYGHKSDVAFAKKLWTALKANRLAGSGRVNVVPVEGEAPHAGVQQILKARLRVAGRRGTAIVKVNHRDAAATLENVYESPNKYLADYAVMFKREKGYDPDAKDWFWALYTPKGRLKVYEGRKIAGRVGRETEEGCIGCHKKKGGADLETLTRD